MVRMRTASGVMDIIREQDPKTQVTVHAIRRLIASGKVPVTALLLEILGRCGCDDRVHSTRR